MTYGEMQTVNGTMAVYQTNRSMETVSLSRLIEFSIQRTYHELTVLTELLPRENDMERKIKIVTFVNRTKQLFIRLLALVKWAGSASKVEKCSNIVSFLDKQSILFTETADVLAKMSRENLAQARLPSFQLPSAVEVLTSGTYTRLPSCIRDRIVPPDPITPDEKRTILLRLNQIIQQRLVSTNLPPQMRNLKIEHGRLIFHIPYEFELTLTLMGDKLQIPWRVLNVVILVEDKETGEGKDLVHSLQTNFLQHLVQEKLTESARPLYDAFEILHTFCLSLQLEVLHAQTVRLSRERLGDFLKVDQYQVSSSLVISYWKDQIVDNMKGCKLVIEIKNQDQNDALVVSHLPELGDQADLANQAIKSDQLSIEKLLICTTHERARMILLQFCEKFENTKYGKSFQYEICGLPPVLQISYLKPCMDSEKLTLSVDVLTGLIMVHIAQFDNCPFVIDIQQSIKKDLVNFETLISDLRIWVTKERFKKSAEYFFTSVHEQLPFSSKESNPVIRSKHQKLFFQFLKNVQHYYLVVVFTDQATDTTNVQTDYYLMNVESASIEYENKFKIDLNEIQKSFLNVKSIIQLNVDCILKSSIKQVTSARKYFGLKRKFDELDHYKWDHDEESMNDQKKDSFFITDLIFLLSFCEEKMAYSFLSNELQKHGFCHHMRFSNNPDHAQYIDIIQIPASSKSSITSNSSNSSDRQQHRLHRTLLSCSINLQGKFNRIWMVTYKFSNESIPESLNKRNSIKSMISTSSDTLYSSPQQMTRLIDEIINDWQQFCKLYDILIDFTESTNYTGYLDVFEINSFDYKKLVINYGPQLNYTVTIVWKCLEQKYTLNFGVIDCTITTSNPHVIVSVQLQNEFNQHKSIGTLIRVLNNTVNSLSTIHQITCIPMFGLINSKPMLPIQTFCLTPQSSTHIRLIYRNVYCIDIVIQTDGYLAIRDGSYNLFDKSKIFEDLTPIQGLKRFLNRFVDKNETANRRYSPNEDDQMSPVAPNSIMETPMESPYTYQSQQHVLKNISSPISSNISINDTLAGQLQRPSNNYHNVHSSNPNTPVPQNTYMPSPASHSETSPVNRQFSVNSPAALHPASSPSTFHHQQSPQIKQQPSPAQPTNWPNSPSIYRPSPRSIAVHSPGSLNQSHSGPGSVGSVHNSSSNFQINRVTTGTARSSWSAAAFPTLLTQAGFDAMCRPNAPNENLNFDGNSTFNGLSHLERFLGCAFMRKNLQQLIMKPDTSLQLIHPNEFGVIQFRSELFLFKILIHPETMQNLQIKIALAPEKIQSMTPDEIETLERFFELKVICEPFKPDAFSTFGRIITTQLKFLKDFIQLMKLELYPDRSFKWTLNLCLTISPGTLMRTLPTGMSAFLHNSTQHKNSMVFFIQLTQNPLLLSANVEPQSIALPILYEINSNAMNVPIKDQAIATLPAVNTINRILSDAPSRPDFPIYHSIREILCNDLITTV